MMVIYVFIFWQSSHKPRVQRASKNTATHLVSNQKLFKKVTLLHCALHLFPFPYQFYSQLFPHKVQSGVDLTPSHFLERNPLSNFAKADHIAILVGIQVSAQSQSWSLPSYMYITACNIIFPPWFWKFSLALRPS